MTSAARCSPASATTCALRSPHCEPRSRRCKTVSRPTSRATCAPWPTTSKRSSSLVDDLFLLSRIEAGQPRTRTRPRRPSRTRRRGRRGAQSRPPPPVRCTIVLRVRPIGATSTPTPAPSGRVIRNLLDNAVRHAPAGSTVEVVIDRRLQHRWCGSIDQGPASIVDFSADRLRPLHPRRPESHPHQRRCRTRPRHRRGLVEAHGGTIWIEPPPGGTVAFEIPVAASPATHLN